MNPPLQAKVSDLSRRATHLVACCLIAGCNAGARAPSMYRLDPGSGRAHAVAACLAIAEVRNKIATDAPAMQVFDGLRRSAEQALQAAHADPKWTPLPGAVAELHRALEKDDADAAQLALDVLNDQCQRAQYQSTQR